jgi:D-beta-D-heptose 7-phosphate kinase/D-beta-D-heptose 1-phosphate adenosyltransferase
MPTPISRGRLVQLLEAARGTRVVIVGDAMLDVYLRGDVDRISPEAPVPVVRVRERKEALGGAANVAQNVVALGASPRLIAAVGNDAAGTRLRQILDAVGVGAGDLVEVSRPTTTKTRILARIQQVVRVDEEDDEDLSTPDAERLANAVDRALEAADALILEDYNKGVLTTPVITRAIAAARARDLPIVVDPKYRNFFAYRGSTIFKPNRRELEAALGAAMDPDHPETLAATAGRLEVGYLLLTLGERGMILVSPSREVVHVPTTAREVYDVVGAGDTVTAYLAVILAANGSAQEAAFIANLAAGVEVGKLGAATVSPEEVIDAWEQYRDGARTHPQHNRS